MEQQNINSQSMLRIGTVLRGIYRIEKFLSSGGFGNTYVATNVEFDERYAIKEFFMKGVTQRDDNQTTVSVSNSENENSFLQQKEKFKKEARRLRKLQNEHIVKVHDMFEENGTAYYVMDYVDGENLSERLKRTGKPMSEVEVRQLLPQILDALKTVHNEGFCHLDIKPSNIMLDKSGKVKLIDFGASKQLGTNGTLTTNAPTAFAQTLGYAPREQMEQNLDKIGPWTDIYALGATLYNLLTNKRPPLPSDIDDDASSDKHIVLPFPNNVSYAMRSLVLQMMKTNRMQRPQSIDALRQTFASSVADHGQQKETFTSSPEAPQFGKREETLFASQTAKEKTLSSSKIGKDNGGGSNNISDQPIYDENQKSNYLLLLVLIIAGVTIIIFILSGNGFLGCADVPQTEMVDSLDKMNQSQNIDTSSTQDIEHSRVISNDVQPLAKNKETVTQVSDNKGNNNAVNVPPLPVEKKEEVKQVVGNKIFDIAEQMPSFKGNVNQWLASNLSYPAVAAENGVQGCVIVQFVVEKGGSVSNVQVVRSIDPALDHEAVRVVKSMPKWNPGMNNGQPIRVKYTLPITFRLQ